jgi:hypothetical protein
MSDNMKPCMHEAHIYQRNRCEKTRQRECNRELQCLGRIKTRIAISENIDLFCSHRNRRGAGEFAATAIFRDQLLREQIGKMAPPTMGCGRSRMLETPRVGLGRRGQHFFIRPGPDQATPCRIWESDGFEYLTSSWRTGFQPLSSGCSAGAGTANHAATDLHDTSRKRILVVDCGQ